MSTITPAILQQLLKVMSSNQQALIVLKKQLEKEQSALRRNDRMALKEISEEKNKAIVEVTNAEKALLSLFQQIKAPFSKAGMMHIISQIPSSQRSPIQNQWKHLQQEIKDCAHLNQVNGKVISRIANGLSSVVSFLNGQDPTQQVYNATGATQRGNGPRFIAEA